MDGLKQRIIGALVLISLAVIFVPMIFDEPHSGRTSTSIRIPEEPPFPEVMTPPPPTAMPEYQSSNGSAENTMAQEKNSSASEFQLIEGVSPQVSEPEPVARATNASEPRVKADPPTPTQASKERSDAVPEAKPQNAGEVSGTLAGGWVVQLGSFGNAENARRLRDNAREKGYNSHLQELSRGDTQLTRVFSGPFANKSEAETAKAKLDKAFNLNSLVTSADK